MDFRVGADALKATILRHAQQFCLKLRRHFADFIKKDRPAAGGLETSDALSHRTGERALFVAEQFALEQRFRDGRAIHFDQWTGRARAPGVDDVGQHFLAHAAFTGDEDPTFRRGDERNVAKQRLQQRTPSDDVTGQLLAFTEPHGRGPGDAGRLADRSQQLIEIDRFGEIIDRAVAHGAHGLANVRIRRHEQDRQDPVLLARAPKRFQT